MAHSNELKLCAKNKNKLRKQTRATPKKGERYIFATMIVQILMGGGSCQKKKKNLQRERSCCEKIFESIM